MKRFSLILSVSMMLLLFCGSDVFAQKAEMSGSADNSSTVHLTVDKAMKVNDNTFSFTSSSNLTKKSLWLQQIAEEQSVLIESITVDASGSYTVKVKESGLAVQKIQNFMHSCLEYKANHSEE